MSFLDFFGQPTAASSTSLGGPTTTTGNSLFGNLGNMPAFGMIAAGTQLMSPDPNRWGNAGQAFVQGAKMDMVRSKDQAIKQAIGTAPRNKDGSLDMTKFAPHMAGLGVLSPSESLQAVSIMETMKERERDQKNKDRSFGLDEAKFKFMQQQAVEKPAVHKLKTADDEEVLVQTTPAGSARRMEIQGMPAPSTERGPLDTKEGMKVFQREIAEKAVKLPQTEQSLNAAVDNIDRALKKAADLSKDPELWQGTGQVGAIGRALPEWMTAGGPYARVSAKLKSLESGAMLDQLQDLRANSPHGGAIGQVTQKEYPILATKVAALDRAQDAESYKKALGDYQAYLMGLKMRLKTAYEKDVTMIKGGGFTPSINQSATDFIEVDGYKIRKK